MDDANWRKQRTKSNIASNRETCGMRIEGILFALDELIIKEAGAGECGVGKK